MPLAGANLLTIYAQVLFKIELKSLFYLEESSSNLLSNTPVHVSPINDGPLVETRIEDGKLSYERRWFHRGQSVYIEGKDMLKFPASISAIRSDYVS